MAVIQSYFRIRIMFHISLYHLQHLVKNVLLGNE